MKKKAVILVVASSLLLMGLAGCKKKVECDLCGEKQYCKQYEILDEKSNICNDCKKEIEEIFGKDALK